MPQNYVKKLAKKHGMSVSQAESKWEKAQQQAAKQGKSDNYAYITGIFKSMMNEDISYEFSSLFEQALYDLGDGSSDYKVSEQHQQELESLILAEGSKKKKSLAKSAQAVYHRDYIKTRNKPYRKYDKKKREHEQAAGVNEGVLDYARGVGRSLRDLHSTGKRESMYADFKRSVDSWLKSYVAFNEFINALDPQEASNLKSGKKPSMNEGIWDNVKSLGNTFKRVSGVRHPEQLSNAEQFAQLKQNYEQQVVKIVNLINRYGPEHKEALSAAWKGMPTKARTTLQNAIAKMQAQLATPQQQPQQPTSQRQQGIHPTGYQHVQRGAPERRRSRYGE